MIVGYNLSHLKVLVVERHQFMRRMLRDIFKQLGITQTIICGDAASGWKAFQDQDVDVLFCDWSPGLDGIGFIRRVRTDHDSTNPYVPIIVLTGFTEMAHVMEARDAGMNEFLAKPISAKLIYSRLVTVIEKQRMFVRTRMFFGPDRRRRRVDLIHPDRRRHANLNGDERRRMQRPFNGPERRQGYPGFMAASRRAATRAADGPDGNRPTIN